MALIRPGLSATGTYCENNVTIIENHTPIQLQRSMLACTQPRMPWQLPSIKVLLSIETPTNTARNRHATSQPFSASCRTGDGLVIMRLIIAVFDKDR
jgi:hypothetical protein